MVVGLFSLLCVLLYCDESVSDSFASFVHGATLAIIITNKMKIKQPHPFLLFFFVGYTGIVEVSEGTGGMPVVLFSRGLVS